MKGVLVDSNVILDVFLNDAKWADWSEGALEELSAANRLFINPMIYAEVSIGFERIEELESALRPAGFILLDIPKEALFLAGKVYIIKKPGTNKSSHRFRKLRGVATVRMTTDEIMALTREKS